MATLTIKKLPEKLHRRLKQSALQHRRSINSEAIACLEGALTSTRVDPEEFLARVRALRESTPKLFVTDEDLREAKNLGRGREGTKEAHWRRVVIVGVLGLALAATACNWLGARHSKRAVDDAIQAHLKQNSRLNLGNFTTTVEDVKFDGDTAQARVKFQSKESANLSVEVGYGLKLENGQWQVVSSAPLSGQGMSAQSPHDTPAGTQPSTPAVPAPEPSH